MLWGVRACEQVWRLRDRGRYLGWHSIFEQGERACLLKQPAGGDYLDSFSKPADCKLASGFLTFAVE